jgi:hypothetical protein
LDFHTPTLPLTRRLQRAARQWNHHPCVALGRLIAPTPHWPTLPSSRSMPFSPILALCLLWDPTPPVAMFVLLSSFFLLSHSYTHPLYFLSSVFLVVSIFLAHFCFLSACHHFLVLSFLCSFSVSLSSFGLFFNFTVLVYRLALCLFLLSTYFYGLLSRVETEMGKEFS